MRIRLFAAKALRSVAKQQVASLVTPDRAQFHHPVGKLEGLAVVTDHDHGAPDLQQFAELAVQMFFFMRMEPRTGFIEDIKHAADGVLQQIGDLDALPLAAGKRGHGAMQGQVTQAETFQAFGVSRQV